MYNRWPPHISAIGKCPDHGYFGIPGDPYSVVIEMYVIGCGTDCYVPGCPKGRTVNGIYTSYYNKFNAQLVDGTRINTAQDLYNFAAKVSTGEIAVEDINEAADQLDPKTASLVKKIVAEESEKLFIAQKNEFSENNKNAVRIALVGVLFQVATLVWTINSDNETTEFRQSLLKKYDEISGWLREHDTQKTSTNPTEDKNNDELEREIINRMAEITPRIKPNKDP